MSTTTTSHHHHQQQHSRLRRRYYNDFANSKQQCIGDSSSSKRDKSSAGQIDHGVRELCTLINTNFEDYYTTSSCAGRCYIYCGTGNKQHRSRSAAQSQQQQQQQAQLAPPREEEEKGQPPQPNVETTTTTTTTSSTSSSSFYRCRVCHSRITEPQRYFDLSTIQSDPSGGSSDYDHNDNVASVLQLSPPPFDHGDNVVWWLRYEPFILHVACRTLASAIRLVSAARTCFKNVGMTTTATNENDDHDHDHDDDDAISSSSWNLRRYHVAIWGDEGLDMPLTSADGTTSLVLDLDVVDAAADTATTRTTRAGWSATWLAELINERHDRNTNKIARFVDAVRNMSTTTSTSRPSTQIGPDTDDDDVADEWDMTDDASGECNNNNNNHHNNDNGVMTMKIPRSYDVIGDVALIHSLPVAAANNDNLAKTDTSDDATNNNSYDTTEQQQKQQQKLEEMGNAIMRRNKSIKVVAIRQSNLIGFERAPGVSGLQIIAGNRQRMPLITTHKEYGIACVVDLHHTFFSPRMNVERLRLCQQIIQQHQPNDEQHVLILYGGVGMEAFQIAAKTTAASITIVEWNDSAVQCIQKGLRLLERNPTITSDAAQRIKVIHGDCLAVLPTLPRQHYHRIIVPRPKEGNVDGNQPPPPPNVDKNITEMDDRHCADDSNNTNTATTTIATPTTRPGTDCLVALLPALRTDGGYCHWYDFCATHEYPACDRTVSFLSNICHEYGYTITVIHIANVGSVAKRQLRICVDFRVYPVSSEQQQQTAETLQG